MLEKLKKRWNITGNLQLAVILFIFSLTGITVLYARKLVFDWMGITSDTSLWIKIPAYVLVIFPLYQLLFLLFGAILGQFRFVWEFEKKMFTRFSCRKSNNGHSSEKSTPDKNKKP